MRWIVLTGPGSGEPPAELAAYVRAEMQKWGKVIKDANIKIE